MEPSFEQKNYIYDVEKCDTKLLATAGSGKTLCVIKHIEYLIKQGIYQPNEIYMLTFSKNAKDDFLQKLSKLEIYDLPFENVNTIDSFAWHVLGDEIAQTIDVSLLSFALLYVFNNINSTKEDIFLKNKAGIVQKIKGVKCVFCDEAQDLNETQYNILMSLKHLNGDCYINLIGDPNQNIYQFRNASDRYLVNFPAKVFELTKNYRSHGHIVEFCSHLRPYSCSSLTYVEREKTLDVTFYSYYNSSVFETYLISLLTFFISKNIPLHKVAILAPTRGYLKTMKGLSKYKGLCYISNLLFKHKIPFKQFYNDSATNAANDSNSNMNSKKITYRLSKGHVNLMTYTASKGLEWDYVIIVDANAHLVSAIDYDVNKYNAEKYLLYVACSRPRKNLIIFTKERFTNTWFKDVPESKYKVRKNNKPTLEFFDHTKLFNTNVGTNEEGENKPRNLSTVINNLDEKILFEITTLLDQKVYKKVKLNLMDNQKIKVPSNKQGFASKFLTHVFYLSALRKPIDDSHFLRDIRNVIRSTNIIFCSNERIIDWYFINRDGMCWSTFNAQKKDLNRSIVEFITQNFDRNKDFSSFTLVDQFYDTFISQNYEMIKNEYNRYINGNFSLKNLLFISLVSYALETTHYFYILQVEQFYKDVVQKNKNKIQCWSNFCMHRLYHKIDELNMKIEDEDTGVFTFLDFYWKPENEIRSTKCVLKPFGTIRLKDIIQMIIMSHLDNTNLYYFEFQLETLQINQIHFNLSHEEKKHIYQLVIN